MASKANNPIAPQESKESWVRTVLSFIPKAYNKLDKEDKLVGFIVIIIFILIILFLNSNTDLEITSGKFFLIALLIIILGTVGVIIASSRRKSSKS